MSGFWVGGLRWQYPGVSGSLLDGVWGGTRCCGVLEMTRFKAVPAPELPPKRMHGKAVWSVQECWRHADIVFVEGGQGPAILARADDVLSDGTKMLRAGEASRDRDSDVRERRDVCTMVLERL